MRKTALKWITMRQWGEWEWGLLKSSSSEHLYKQVGQGQAWRQGDGGSELEEPSHNLTHPHTWRGEQKKLLVVKTLPKQINGGFRRLKWVPSFPLFPSSVFTFLLICLTNKQNIVTTEIWFEWLKSKVWSKDPEVLFRVWHREPVLRRQRELNAYLVPLCWACVIYVERHQGSQQPSPLISMVNGPVLPSKASSETRSRHQRATAMERTVWLCFRLVSMAMGAPSSLSFSPREGQGYPREDSRNERKEKVYFP